MVVNEEASQRQEIVIDIDGDFRDWKIADSQGRDLGFRGIVCVRL